MPTKIRAASASASASVASASVSASASASAASATSLTLRVPKSVECFCERTLFSFIAVHNLLYVSNVRMRRNLFLCKPARHFLGPV